MTNFEYIKSTMTERDLAEAVTKHIAWTPWILKIRYAFDKWAESTSSNHGNMAKGLWYNDREIKENPSIWAWEIWHYPDGTTKKMGRPPMVAFQVWLAAQYNPEDWDEDWDED